MSDTPRTDAQLLTVKDCSYVAPHPTGEYVHAEFARELERENAALRSLVRIAITEHVDPYDLPEGDHYIARAEAVLGIPPTQEAVTAARAKEAKP